MRLRRKFLHQLIFLAVLTIGLKALSADAAATACQGESLCVLINEIAWMGTSASANAEWIELRNFSAEEADLTGWTISARDGQPSIILAGKIAGSGYFLLERTSDESAAGIAADQIYTGALGNGGEYLELKDASGSILQTIDGTAGWPAGDNDSKKTMELKAEGLWQTSQNPGGTPKAENSSPASGSDDEIWEQPDYESNDTSATSTPASEITADETKANLGDIVINELVSDPDDSDVEWVELFNKTSVTWNLAGWTIEDGSGAKTPLSGEIGLGKDRFFVVEKPKGNLNNAGDKVILKDGEGNLIDQLSYGNWGNGENNAPAAGDPYSAARIYDGYNTFNNLNDFRVTKKITKGSANIIEAPVTDNVLAGACQYINFSEILPDPAGDEASDEFIEIYNSGALEIDLTGWSIKDESGKEFIIKIKAEDIALNKKIIRPGEYLAFYRSESKIALNNTSDKLELFEAAGESSCQSLSYEKAKEDFSFSYDFSTRRWFWSEIKTPGEENVIKKINTPPDPDFEYEGKTVAGLPIKFSSSDTIDEEGDRLNFFWDFGDGITNRLPDPEHTFLKAGNFAVNLRVSDGQATSTKEKIIKIFASDRAYEVNADSENTADHADEENLAINLAEEQPNIIGIKLNELFPDPAGSDLEGEFIELWNPGESRVNAVNWSLTDGSKTGKYIFKDDFWLEPDEYFFLTRKISGLTLNNDNDQARLFNSLDQLADEVSYSGAMEGASYSRGENGKWFWTINVTPGKKNVIAVSETVKNNVSGAIAGIKTINAAENIHEDYEEMEISQVAALEKGQKIKTRGIVSVLPGIFGSQYFYISTSTSSKSAGIQVYNYKKEFPKLKAGDLIAVQGELSESAGEKRLKTSSIDDIAVTQENFLLEPVLTNGDEIENLLSGALVKISGLVTGKKGYEFYLDDGMAEMKGYVKQGTGIKMASIKAGDNLELTGVLVRNDSGARIQPREESDLRKIAEPLDLLNESGDGGAEYAQVLGEIPPESQWELAKRDRKLEMLKYLLIISGATIVLLLVWLVKLMKK